MKIMKYLFILSLVFFALSACKKEEDPNNNPEYDHSLIVASTNPEGNAEKLIFVNPVDGKEVFHSSPDLVGIKKFAAGYMTTNVLLTSLTGSDITINSLFICDAKTGSPVNALTSENELNVMDISGSSTESKIVFTAKPASGAEYYQLYAINDDGSNLVHSSMPLEPVTGLNGGNYELLDIESPAISPDGQKTAFNAHVDNTDSIPNSIFYDGVMILSSDRCKKMLYWEQGKDRGIDDVCWTRNGQFLIFMIKDPDNSLHNLIKAVNIENKNTTDLTASLEINGVGLWNLATSPNADKIVFTQYLSGGSDLFIAEFEIHDDVLTIKGSPVKLTNRESTGYNYYTPSWQLWDEHE